MHKCIHVNIYNTISGVTPSSSNQYALHMFMTSNGVAGRNLPDVNMMCILSYLSLFGGPVRMHIVIIYVVIHIRMLTYST
jgi:hypothetical protein